MRASTLAAGLSLAGVTVCIILYSFYPLPSSANPWTDADLWLSIVLLIAGLVCFIVLLISGLITLLNWNSDAKESRGREP